MTTLAEAKAHYDDAVAALEASRLATQFGEGDRQITRATLAELRKEVGFWAREVRRLNAMAAGVKASATHYSRVKYRA